MSPTLRRVSYIFLAWTVLGLLAACQYAVSLTTQGQPFEWTQLLLSRLIDWYSCGIFTPVFFWLVKRYPLGRADWLRRAPLYLAVSMVTTVGKFALQRFIILHLVSGRFPLFGTVLASGFVFELMAFWCVIAVVHALEFHQRGRERDVLTARLQARVSAAQLDALAARLNPHFLFNTLQGISTLVHRDPTAADAMLGHLSTLLRKALERDQGHEVTLAEELTLLEEYLAIVQVRFADRVSIVRRIDPATLTGLVPRLLLQPLVENAIEHGISRRAGAGRIDLAATRENGKLTITVSDDGPGLSRVVPDGLGLGTTRLRLAELYGDAAALGLAPGNAGGLTATLVLPWHEQPIGPRPLDPPS